MQTVTLQTRRGPEMEIGVVPSDNDQVAIINMPDIFDFDLRGKEFAGTQDGRYHPAMPNLYTAMMGPIAGQGIGTGVLTEPENYDHTVRNRFGLNISHLEDLIDDMKADPGKYSLAPDHDVLIIGHEYGAHLAMAVADKHPQVKRLLLVDPNPLKGSDRTRVEKRMSKFDGSIHVVELPHSWFDHLSSDDIRAMASNASVEAHSPSHYDDRVDHDLLVNAVAWAFAGRAFAPSDVASRLYCATLRYMYRKEEYETMIDIHPNTTGKVIVHSAGGYSYLPGQGRINDSVNRTMYAEMAQEMQRSGFAVVRMDSNKRPARGGAGEEYDFGFHVHRIQQVRQYIKDHAEYITGSARPEVSLSGIDGGGRAALAAADSGIRSVLAFDIHQVRRASSDFVGPVYLVPAFGAAQRSELSDFGAIRNAHVAPLGPPYDEESSLEYIDFFRASVRWAFLGYNPPLEQLTADAMPDKVVTWIANARVVDKINDPGFSRRAFAFALPHGGYEPFERDDINLYGLEIERLEIDGLLVARQFLNHLAEHVPGVQVKRPDYLLRADAGNPLPVTDIAELEALHLYGDGVIAVALEGEEICQMSRVTSGTDRISISTKEECSVDMRPVYDSFRP